MALSIYAFDRNAKRAWVFSPSYAWYRRYDNGKAISIGYSVPDELTEARLKKLHAREVSYEEYAHSGCQSRCKLRGDTKCQW